MTTDEANAAMRAVAGPFHAADGPLYRAIWNAAIEAAARVATDMPLRKNQGSIAHKSAAWSTAIAIRALCMSEECA